MSTVLSFLANGSSANINFLENPYRRSDTLFDYTSSLKENAYEQATTVANNCLAASESYLRDARPYSDHPLPVSPAPDYPVEYLRDKLLDPKVWIYPTPSSFLTSLYNSPVLRAKQQCLFYNLSIDTVLSLRRSMRDYRGVAEAIMTDMVYGDNSFSGRTMQARTLQTINFADPEDHYSRYIVTNETFLRDMQMIRPKVFQLVTADRASMGWGNWAITRPVSTLDFILRLHPLLNNCVALLQAGRALVNTAVPLGLNANSRVATLVSDLLRLELYKYTRPMAGIVNSLLTHRISNVNRLKRVSTPGGSMLNLGYAMFYSLADGITGVLQSVVDVLSAHRSPLEAAPMADRKLMLGIKDNLVKGAAKVVLNMLVYYMTYYYLFYTDTAIDVIGRSYASGSLTLAKSEEFKLHAIDLPNAQLTTHLDPRVSSKPIEYVLSLPDPTEAPSGHHTPRWKNLRGISADTLLDFVTQFMEYVNSNDLNEYNIDVEELKTILKIFILLRFNVWQDYRIGFNSPGSTGGRLYIRMKMASVPFDFLKPDTPVADKIDVINKKCLPYEY